MSLKVEDLEELEKFIIQNKPKNPELIKRCVLNGNQLDSGKICYIKIKDTTYPQYCIFSSTMSGMSYALYKSKNENIYLIEVHFQKINSYSIIESEDWFDN
jgi:hypothetical protein